MTSEYTAFVDYRKIDPFKHAMELMGPQTFAFPNRRRVLVDRAGVYQYVGLRQPAWKMQPEGLGNKSGIAEIMSSLTGDPRHFAGVGIDTCMMAALDVARFGALPVICGDEVIAGRSEWFEREDVQRVIVSSFYEGCRQCGMALIGGESPVYRFLVNPAPPVPEASIFSVSAVGVIDPPERRIHHRVQSGAQILGVRSSGLHANGASLVISEGAKLADGFLHVLPNGCTYGGEALIPTANYIPLIEALLASWVDILAIVPVTGSGVAKLANYQPPFTYRINRWVEYPPLFRFLLSRGVSLQGCLTTFNMGIGVYFLAREAFCDKLIGVGRQAGYEVIHLGEVEDGERKVIFEPENGITLQPVS